MDPQEELGNTGPDDETVIRERKRSRRVSFAENTEVHFFDRDDEDCGETPPQPPPSPLVSPKSHHHEDPIGIYSPSSASPGSAVSSAASANSNDEDNFFGPVNPNFISLGQHSNSAASDDHDITLDSTAFSMHFQSLAQSDCNTPTPNFQPQFSLPNNSDSQSQSYMIMTGVKKHFQFSSAGESSAGTCDSNEMSLVRSSPPQNKYDYARLSPTMEKLLAQIRDGPVSDQTSVSNSPNHNVPQPTVSDVNSRLFDPNTGSASPLVATSVDPRFPDSSTTHPNQPHIDADQRQGAHPQQEQGHLRDSGGTITNDVNVLGAHANGSITHGILKSSDDRDFQYQTTEKKYESIENFQTPSRRGSFLKSPLGNSDLSFSTWTDPGKTSEKLSESNTVHKSASPRVHKPASAIRLDKRLVDRVCARNETQDDTDSRSQVAQKDFGSAGDFLTPLRRGDFLNSPLGTSDLSFLVRTDPAKTREKFHEHNPLHKSASPRVRTSTVTRLEKRFREGVRQDLGTNETGVSSESDSLHPFLRKGPLSYTSIKNSAEQSHSGLQSHQILQERFPLQDVDIVEQKRKEVEPMDKSNSDELGNKKPKVTIDMEGSVSEFQLYVCPVGNSEVEKAEGYKLPGHWIDVLKELPESMERFLFPSIRNLDTPELDLLEDILGRMQKATKYEKVSTVVQFQRILDLVASHHQGRIAEAKWLQETSVYEQAKFLLLRIKQDRLCKKVQELQSGVLETNKLKFGVKNIIQNDAKCSQEVEVTCPSVSVDLSQENTDGYNQLLTKRRELEYLDMRVQTISKSLIASCEIKEEENPDECKVLINEYLRKKARCRSIQNELQLYEVKGLKRENGHCNLILTYFDILYQSFIMTHGSFPKLVTVNELIEKSFPNMKACTAFEFVFNTAARNLVNSKSLAIETQMARSRLHILLIVIGEVQLACRELRNLVQTSFRSRCVGLLELELCFVDFKTGNKLMVILDMTCLNCGVYPRETHPQICFVEKSKSLSMDLETTIKSLKGGNSMVLRLSRRVSQLLTSSK